LEKNKNNAGNHKCGTFMMVEGMPESIPSCGRKYLMPKKAQ